MARETLTFNPLARVAYSALGDCLRHTQDVLSRFQDQAVGTNLFLVLEGLRQEVATVQSGQAYGDLATESLVGEFTP